MDDRRAQILEAAERLLDQYGPQKTTIADIARAANVGVGSVYLEFPNKNALLLALSEARHRHVLRAIEWAWAGPGDIEVRLQRALTARLDAFLACASEGSHAADLLHCRACGPIQRAHQAFREAERTLFTGFLEQGRETGRFQFEDARRTAHALLIAYESFTPPNLFAWDRKALHDMLEEVHRLVLRGLVTR